jgi:predicted metal-dependent phosphotriesterase family hydrolase
MPIHVQKELADMGALIEQCYSMYSIDKIPISKIARQIKLLGAKNCILSSDVGQIFSKNPSEALADFMFLLEKEGITKQELRQMLVNNPIRLLNK